MQYHIYVRWNKIVAALLLAGTLAANARATTLRFQSGAKPVPLLELYTSEGCSSCPPAEEWLGRLKDSPGLWRDFSPLALHVHYWDSPSWRDHWSAPEYTERQRSYAAAWHADNIYTPCFVLQGREWRGWFMHSGVPAAAGEDIGVLAVDSTNALLWKATFVPVMPAGRPYEIHAALLAGGLDSEVLGGENDGRRLHHEFVVLDLIQIGLGDHHGVAHGKFILDPKRFPHEKSLALTVWVTVAGEMTPLQSTGGWLTPPVPPVKSQTL